MAQTASPHRRRLLKMRTAILIAISTVAISVGAATYYVDYSAGSDSSSGTSASTPFQHAPGDPRRGGAVPASLAAGDSVLFKSGVSYVLTNSGINAGWSGASNAPITYASFGSGQAILTTGTESASVTSYGITGSAFRQWLVISNLAFVDIGGIRPADPIWSTDTDGCTTNLLTAPAGGSAISFSSGLSHSWIVNNTIQGVGTWTNASPLSGTQSVSGTGISLEGATNVTIAGNSLSYMRTGIRFQGTSTRWFSQLYITNNSIGDWMVWLIDGSAAAAAARFEDVQIVGNRLYNKYQHDQSQWTGCGDAPHTDGIFLRNSGQPAVWERTVIANNIFYSDAASSSGGTAMIYLSEGGGGNCALINNVFLNAHDSAVIQIAPTSRQVGGRTVWILHNTFGGSTRNIRFTGTNHTIYAEGNIFTRTASSANNTIINFESTNSYSFRRNLYFNPSIPTGTYYPFYRLNWASGWNGYTTFSLWTSLGYDTQSQWGDPAFIDGTNASPSARNLRPGASSVARNLAPDLASIYPQWAQWLMYDKDGVERVEPFDAGAYQYTGYVPPEPPPAGGITIQNVTAGTLR